jgi:hypothetical protein
MVASSSTPLERARKGVQLALRALQEPGKAGALAVSMGISDSTVSRIKTERLEEVLLFLSHLGIKCVPSEYQCVDPKTFAAFEVLFAKAMSQTTPAKLIFEDAD